MLQALKNTDFVPQATAKKINKEHKANLGQFMTPASIARFMASLVSDNRLKEIRLLDAGAGIGSLICAFLDRISNKNFNCTSLNITACEIDGTLYKNLSTILNDYSEKLNFQSHLLSCDFIEYAVQQLQSNFKPNFTHAILNPPYKKINSHSNYRFLLRKVGIETVNLYSAFVSLALLLMQDGGQVVAIIPRSFCNGSYYKSFRKLIFSQASIKQIHLFTSRSEAFKDDAVLQENVIIFLERGSIQKDVIISTSTDSSFNDFTSFSNPFHRIVSPNDPEKFIHIPTSSEDTALEKSNKLCYSLSDIDIQVSTGPVVDFRVKKYIRDMPELGCVPLLYPNHFSGLNVEWPKKSFKKPNALIRHVHTEKWLYPNGFYTVVRRFSSKEEKRRIIASVVSPIIFRDFQLLGFENHLNVFHFKKQSLQEEMALGLFVFLNSSLVDIYFRKFNGHTQVNATDLRTMKYPSKEILINFGCWVKKQKSISQQKIDAKVATAL